jgi:hypothetical protein
LALQEAARLAFALPQRPSAKEMVALAEMWRPLRAVAARVLWTYYRAVKGRDGAPIAPSPASVVAQALPRFSPKPGRSKQERISRGRSKEGRSKRGRNGRRT